MTVYNERCTIVANPNGSIKTVFVDQMGIDDAGRHYSIGQATIGDEALTQFLGNSHNVALAGITKLTSDLAAKTTEHDTTKAALDKLTEDMAKRVEDHKTELDLKEAALTEKTTENNSLKNSIVGHELTEKILRESVEALTNERDEYRTKSTQAEALATRMQGRLDVLLNELPFNPREISVGAFKARLFSVLETEDVVRLYAAQPDSTLEQIAATITNWDHAFPIRLDSPELLNPLGYLVSINLLTVAEVANLRRDCTRAEAFIATV